jgi:hypothetical protein
MVGESQTLDLTDIDLQAIRAFNLNSHMDKSVCFLRESVVEMHYTMGAHLCDPHGKPVVRSSKVYTLKHMAYLGLPFITNKMVKRFQRTELMRSWGLAIHYTDDTESVRHGYLARLKSAQLLDQNSGFPTNIS